MPRSRSGGSFLSLTSTISSPSSAEPATSAAPAGPGGGHELARGPDEITLLEVLESLEGSLAPMECVNEAPGSDAGALCGQQWVWQDIYADMRVRLGDTTIADLVEHEREHERQTAATYSI